MGEPSRSHTPHAHFTLRLTLFLSLPIPAAANALERRRQRLLRAPFAGNKENVIAK